nr:hypothetical protein BaRGS_032072 [Batillaria attramentaria]
MCDMIQRHTNRGCLDYNDYGCYCGWGNAGSEGKHLDDVDGFPPLEPVCPKCMLGHWFSSRVHLLSSVCNNLRAYLKSGSATTKTFKRNLKMHLFSQF